MSIERFTQKAQEALQSAQSIAARYNHQQMDVEHLLLALLEQHDGLIPRILQRMDVPLDSIREEVDKTLSSLPSVSGVGGQAYITQRLSRLLESAENEAKRLKDEYVSAEHLFIAMAGDTEGACGRILSGYGVTKDRIMQVLFEVRGSQRVISQTPEETYEALERYGRDFTKLARGELHCIGATTLDEYRKNIEKDAALVNAAVLSNRYISDRFLPDKAIDLVDESAAKIRTEIDSMPSELDEKTRRIMQLEIEREALRKEKDIASKERLEQLEKELAELRAETDALKAQNIQSSRW